MERFWASMKGTLVKNSKSDFVWSDKFGVVNIVKHVSVFI